MCRSACKVRRIRSRAGLFAGGVHGLLLFLEQVVLHIFFGEFEELLFVADFGNGDDQIIFRQHHLKRDDELLGDAVKSFAHGLNSEGQHHLAVFIEVLGQGERVGAQ